MYDDPLLQTIAEYLRQRERLLGAAQDHSSPSDRVRERRASTGASESIEWIGPMGVDRAAFDEATAIGSGLEETIVEAPTSPFERSRHEHDAASPSPAGANALNQSLLRMEHKLEELAAGVKLLQFGERPNEQRRARPFDRANWAEEISGLRTAIGSPLGPMHEQADGIERLPGRPVADSREPSFSDRLGPMQRSHPQTFVADIQAAEFREPSSPGMPLQKVTTAEAHDRSETSIHETAPAEPVIPLAAPLRVPPAPRRTAASGVRLESEFAPAAVVQNAPAVHAFAEFLRPQPLQPLDQAGIKSNERPTAVAGSADDSVRTWIDRQLRRTVRAAETDTGEPPPLGETARDDALMNGLFDAGLERERDRPRKPHPDGDPLLHTFGFEPIEPPATPFAQPAHTRSHSEADSQGNGQPVLQGAFDRLEEHRSQAEAQIQALSDAIIQALDQESLVQSVVQRVKAFVEHQQRVQKMNQEW